MRYSHDSAINYISYFGRSKASFSNHWSHGICDLHRISGFINHKSHITNQIQPRTDSVSAHSHASVKLSRLVRLIKHFYPRIFFFTMTQSSSSLNQHTCAVEYSTHTQTITIDRDGILLNAKKHYTYDQPWISTPSGEENIPFYHF